MSIPSPFDAVDAAAGLIARLTAAHRTIAVAESLTGGALIAALVAVPGASAVLRGGVVAYDTALKHSLLGVDADLLAEHGPVHPEVALAMARGVRATAAVDGAPADLGISTTGVAGPDPQGSAPVGLVFIAVADARGEVVRELRLLGDRAAIREQTVAAALALAADRASASRE